MAIICCTECGHGVSDKAASCPKCGNPILATKLDGRAEVREVGGDFASLEFSEARSTGTTRARRHKHGSPLLKVIMLGIGAGVIYVATQLFLTGSISKAKQFVGASEAAYEEEQPEQASEEAANVLSSIGEKGESPRPDDTTIVATIRDVAQSGAQVQGDAIPADAVAITNITVDHVEALDGSTPPQLYQVRATVSSKITSDSIKDAILKRNPLRADGPPTLHELQNMGELVNRAISRELTVDRVTETLRIGTEIRYVLDAQIRRTGATWSVVSAHSTEIPRSAAEIEAVRQANAEASDAAADAAEAVAADAAAAASDSRSLATGERDSSSASRYQQASVHMTPPTYPPEEQKRGITGTVILVVAIDEAGNFSDSWVEKSSGNRNLDSAAVAASRNWTFSPEIQDGKPVASKARVPVDFSLR